MTQACENQKGYVGELREGQAPRDASGMMRLGMFYREHGIECPKCERVTQSRGLTDIKAAFGVKVRCGMCEHQWIYRWSPL